MLKRKLLCLLITLISLVSASASGAASFQLQTVNLPVKVVQSVVAGRVLAGQQTVVVIGSDEQGVRKLLLLTAAPEQSNKLAIQAQAVLPASILAYDLGDENDGQQGLYLLTRDRVLQVQLADDQQLSFLPIADVKTLLQTDLAASVLNRDFAQDINDDGRDDFVLPHFNNVSLYLSHCCGNRHFQSLPIEAMVELNDNGISVKDPRLFFADITGDGKQDVIHPVQGKLMVFPQLAEGQFSLVASETVIHQSIFGKNWWDIREADGQSLDQSNLAHRVVEEIKDINADGVVDLVVRFTRSTGVLDRLNDYEFYFGKRQEGNFSLPLTPSTTISSEETLSGMNLVDIEQDGKLEIMVSAFDIGVSEIIGALLSGSIAQDVHLYALNSQDNYDKKPVESVEVELSFSLSKGRSGNPLAKLADINADGILDIVYSDGVKRLKVLPGENSSKSKFDKRAKRFDLTLPQDASQTVATDLNNDGRADLVFFFGRLDKEQQQSQLTVAFAN